jgi:hypothetical protein
MRTIVLTEAEAETVCVALKEIAHDLMLNDKPAMATGYRELAYKFAPTTCECGAKRRKDGSFMCAD